MNLEDILFLYSHDFAPLWSYVENTEITYIDYNGSDLWITNKPNELFKVEDHGVTQDYIEKFRFCIANNVIKEFIKMNSWFTVLR